MFHIKLYIHGLGVYSRYNKIFGGKGTKLIAVCC